jgi:Lon-like protease
MRRSLATVALVVSTTVAVLVAGSAAVLAGAVPCALLSLQPRCEVALIPGPTEDTLGLVAIEGARTFPTAGELLLTTVAVRDDLDVSAWWEARRSSAVETVPRESIYPDGSDLTEVSEQNALLMQDSQTTATLAALEAAGYDVSGAASGAGVVRVEDDAVTDDLVEGDVIVAVDGEEVREAAEVVDLVRSREPGTQLELGVRAVDGAPRDVIVTLASNPDEPGRAYIGVLLATDLQLPIDVQIDAGIVGGPSAGLMFALGVVELLGEQDLTGGSVVAGTGTITAEGEVGPVGGVQQKIAAAAAREAPAEPATIFLVPRDNLAEARETAVANDVLLVPIDDLDGALQALDAVGEGRPPGDALALPATASD